MFARTASFTALAVLISLASAQENQVSGQSTRSDAGPAGDPRQLVDMPEEARAIMRREMLDHLAALNDVLAHLAAGDLDAAAVIAESRMGVSSMGKHRGTGMGPGRYMPQAMRSLGRSMHESASAFSRLAKQGDSAGALAALQKVTSSCVACHYSYRTR